jgi:hypothetical protein
MRLGKGGQPADGERVQRYGHGAVTRSVSRARTGASCVKIGLSIRMLKFRHSLIVPFTL